MECGGKRSATPLWMNPSSRLASAPEESKAGVGTTLCHRTMAPHRLNPEAVVDTASPV